MPPEARKFEVFTNKRGTRSGQGRVGYRGPLGKQGDPPRIKLDLAADEVLVLSPVQRPVHHPYTDVPSEGIHVLSYSFEEVFAEKMRALAERQRPRDLYDVVHLFRRQDMQPDRALLRSTLSRKCEFKGIPVPTFAALTDRPERTAIEVEWEQMLAHQLTASGPLAAPALERTVSHTAGLGLGRPMARKTSTQARARPGGPKSSAGFVMSYAFACAVCGKTFKRRTYDATLSPHKNKQGWPCPGRIGYPK